MCQAHEGSIAIGDAFVLEGARLSVAPRAAGAEGTPGRIVELEDPPWTARTALLRDHWVLEAKLVERAPGRGAGVHRIRLGWNGELAGGIYVGARTRLDRSACSSGPTSVTPSSVPTCTRSRSLVYHDNACQTLRDPRLRCD